MFLFLFRQIRNFVWMKRVLNGIACTCGIAASSNESSDFDKKKRKYTLNKSTLFDRWNSEKKTPLRGGVRAPHSAILS